MSAQFQKAWKIFISDLILLNNKCPDFYQQFIKYCLNSWEGTGSGLNQLYIRNKQIFITGSLNTKYFFFMWILKITISQKSTFNQKLLLKTSCIDEDFFVQILFLKF